MNIQSIILFLITGVLFISCTKEEIVNRSEQINGTATRITLTLKSERQQLNENQGMTQTNRALPFPYEIPTTGSMIGSKTFTPKNESLITNVHILVFDPTGQIVSNNYIGELNFSETATIVSETYCGENMDVWVIANGDVNDTEETHLKDKLDKVESINDLQTLLISTKENGLSRSDRLTMIGSTTITIAPSMEPIPIQMHYLAAKVTVTVTDNTPADVEITITGWDVVNIPKRTYLKERMKEDAVNGTVSADYLTTTEEYPFETISTKSWGQSFYLFENRRGNRVDRALPTNPSERYPGMSVSDNNQRGKAWYAPPGATYMLIYGTYSMNGQKNNVVYKIYLGENAHNNYDVVRGKHYTFNVTIKGLNQIDIDTTVDWGNSSFTVTPYGDLEAMDAHPDFRVLRIGATAAETNTPGYVTVEVLNNDNTPCNWLSVSPLNLYRHGIKQAGNPNQSFDDATGCFVRTKYTPAVADELEFANATFGITKKLTKIPFHQLAVFTFGDVVVYADEFNGTGDRKAKVRVTYYKDENGTSSAVGQQELEVAQQDAIKISDDLYMERYEESAMTLQPGIPSNLQGANTDKMQWGYSSQVLYGNQDRYTDGAFLTANAVYKNVTRGNNLDAPTWSPITSYTSYRDLYPRVGEKVSTPSSLQTESVYFYPVLDNTTISTHYFDPIYNSSAARYCHEKNRDTNGNGIIDEGETVWYLPSLADILYIAQNPPTSTSLTGTYWTSTEEDAGHTWVYGFPSSGTASTEKASSHRVRCVRGNGIAALPDISLKSSQADPSKINYAASGGSVAIDIADHTGLPWTVTSSTPAWLTFNSSETSSEAISSYIGFKDLRMYAFIHENFSTTAGRTGTITLQRRDSPTKKTILVTQARKILPATMQPLSMELGFLAGESQALDIDDQGTGVQWTVTSSAPAWLLISTDALGSDAAASKSGNGRKRLFAYTKVRNTVDARSATITLTQTGVSSQPQINVGQKKVSAYYPPMHNGIAGSNIYWEPDYKNEDGTKGRLMFDDVGETTHQYYIGVNFWWGSLIPLSPNLYAKLFSPSSVNADITKPVVGQGEISDMNQARHFLLEIHDPSINRGDICRYMTERGWAPGAKDGVKWRMPTAAEWGKLLSPMSLSLGPKSTAQAADSYGKAIVYTYALQGNGLVIPAGGFPGSPINNTFYTANYGDGGCSSVSSASCGSNSSWINGALGQKLCGSVHRINITSGGYIYSAVRCVRE